MRKMLWTMCLMTMAASLTGCADLRTEARASALLDVSEPFAKDHAEALAGSSMGEARRSGARLLAILGEWYQ